MSIFETLGELIGKAFKSLFDSISGLLKFKGEQLSDIDRELAVASLNPDKYVNPDVKKLVKDIKDSLKHSPASLSEWVETIFTKVFGTINDVIIKVMIPYGVPDFETAKANAGYLSSAFSGFILLAATLDAVGTAMSGTLVRNIFRYIAFMLQFFGFQKYMDIALMPAVGASLVPMLEQGYNAQYQTLVPGTGDIIRMAVREAFTPEIAEKFGQYEDFPEAIVPWLAKSGLSRDWATRHWAAHWGLPGSGDGFEMLHRGIIDEEGLKLLLRANDIMPYWRDQLIKLSWNIPTRIDVRRFWDMRTIDEARLREVYIALGYHGKDLEDYILWTKIFTDFPDLLARYKNGWITLDQVKSELIAMGMKPERADTMIEEKIKKAAPERVAAEKDLTKADIIAGVKKGIITRVEAGELLTDIGYSSDEAIYLLDVNIPTDEETSVKTARELTKSDILAGLKTGVITEQDALNKLLELRYTAADAAFLLKVYQSAVKPPEEAKLKEASKADIVTAVKKGLITQEAGYMMLLDIGFAADAALFILSVATEESPFSPVTFGEFKDQTQKYRLAAGMEGKPMTEEIKKLGAEVVRLSAEVEALQRSIKEEQGKLLDTEVLPEAATARVKELQAILYRTQSELVRVKTDYNAKVAEWRHAAK